MESAYAIESMFGSLYHISEQEFIDCDPVDSGCEGGNPGDAFDFSNNGTYSMKAEDYPYRGNKANCSNDNSKGVLQTRGWAKVPANNQTQFIAALSLRPFSVAVEANNTVFTHYTSGILNSQKCGTKVDHAVVAVGWGLHKGKTHYILRNSWGEHWGEGGYIRVEGSKAGPGTCGV